MNVGTAELECWFLTGSQHLYGEETLERSRRRAPRSSRRSMRRREIPVRIVPKPVLTGSDEIRQVCLEANATPNCIGVIAWMHTFSPAKAWIAGLEALQQPLLHLHTQANRSLPVGHDRHGLHEPQPVSPRRPRVRLHHRAPRHPPQGGGRACERAVDPREDRRLALAPPPAGMPPSNLRVARFGDNMRDVAVTDGDRVEAQRTFGWSIQAHSINDLADAVEQRSDRDGGRAHGRLRAALRVVPDAARRRRAPPVAARRRADRGGPQELPERNCFDAFTTNFQDLGALKQLPGIAPQRLMADGYGFAAEGDWKTAALLRVLKVMADGRPGGTSFMEDYTYHFGPGEPLILGAHMLEICPSISSQQPQRRDPSARDRRPRGPGQACVRRRPRPRLRGRDPRPGGPLPARRQHHRDRAAARAATQPPRRQGDLEARTRACPPRRSAGSPPADRITQSSPPRSSARRSRTSPPSPESSWHGSTTPPPPRVHPRTGLEQRLPPDVAAMSTAAPTRARHRLRHALRPRPGARPRRPAPSSPGSTCPTRTARSRTRCPAAICGSSRTGRCSIRSTTSTSIERGIPQALVAGGRRSRAA